MAEPHDLPEGKDLNRNEDGGVLRQEVESGKMSINLDHDHVEDNGNENHGFETSEANEQSSLTIMTETV